MNCLGNVLKILLLKFGYKSVFMELLGKLEFTLDHFLKNSSGSEELFQRGRAGEALAFATALKTSLLEITEQETAT
ncbi:MAG: hypothetical protein ABIJ36_01850 [Patescibacteria group bacterium]